MYGVFRIGRRELYVPAENLDRIIEIGGAETFPGCPFGVDGLIELKGRFVPMVSRRVLVEDREPPEDVPLDMAAILLLNGDFWAIRVDDVLGLRERIEDGPGEERPIVVDGADVWNRIAALNEGSK